MSERYHKHGPSSDPYDVEQREMRDDEEYIARCPACGDPIDYCQGHGQIGDPVGYRILACHDRDDHGGCHWLGCEDAYFRPDPRQRLEYLRQEIRAERISYSELAELADLAPFIDERDVELLQWAGVPEEEVNR
jgi:hypothetical protein